eukprot:TRINITY_DN31494_c0_g1_i1.p1 TRINITY_DN31494_c0_g1~~TRINITY_DN31494_c0_g1_i1.p1  ORF type:complete len:107 (-),score=12.79 TRINITY_DN31494_c0_g1_i1:94-414(-)
MKLFVVLSIAALAVFSNIQSVTAAPANYCGHSINGHANYFIFIYALGPVPQDYKECSQSFNKYGYFGACDYEITWRDAQTFCCLKPGDVFNWDYLWHRYDQTPSCE